MRKKIVEGTVMFLSVLKWAFLATIIGVVVGVLTTGFLMILDKSIECRGILPIKYYYLLPFAIVISILLVKYFAPDAKGHGTEKVIEAVHKNNGEIKFSVIPVKLVATVVTIMAGGSVGKEGPGAQIGGGTASWIADLFKFSESDRKKFVICGISGGFAAVFGTPIAGAIFGVEVLFIGVILYDVLLPSFISGVMAYQVARALGIKYSYFKIDFSRISNFSETIYLKVIIAGIVFGLISFLFIEILKITGKIIDKVKLNESIKGFIGGILIIGLVFITSESYLGLGIETINRSLTGEILPWYTSFIKMIFTALSLGFGASGGIVTPIFYIGTTSGNLFAQLINEPVALFSSIGFVAVLAGTTNTPIAASIMAIELFGVEISPYAAVACIISFLISGHRSVYPSQILAMKKSRALDIEIGKEIENTKVNFQNDDIDDIIKKLKALNFGGGVKVKLHELIKEDDIIFLETTGVKDTLEVMITKAKEKGHIKDIKEFKNAIFEREDMVSTGIGLGIAMPHAKLENINNFFIMVGVAKQGLDWDSIDRKPVGVVFLIGGPDGKQKKYLKIISKLILLVKNENRRVKLFNSKKEEDIVDIFKEF